MAGKNRTNRQSRKASDRAFYALMTAHLDAQFLVLIRDTLEEFDRGLT